MGMSIDEAIEYNKNLKMYMEINDKYDEYKFLKEHYIALNMAINVMRKYQIVEEIYYHQSGKALENCLKAVIEDGNVD